MNDALGNRMKRYEDISRHKLIQRMPIIIRIDGKAFHSWIGSQFKKPIDPIIHEVFARTTRKLLSNIQGATIAYYQSDEISLFLHTYTKFGSQIWFDGNIQKIASVAASMTTAYFNSNFIEHIEDSPAMFDCRVFNIPREEVANYFLWRIKDAHRNIVQSVARYYMGHKAVQNKSIEQLLTLMTQTERDNVEKYKQLYPIIFKDFNKHTESIVNDPNEYNEQRELIDFYVNYQEEG